MEPTDATTPVAQSPVVLAPALVSSDEEPQRVAPVVPTPAPIPQAPRARFSQARKQLGNFARTGDDGSLKKALGHYVRSGIGGKVQGARRMAGTARTAGAIYDTFHALRSGHGVNPTIGLVPALLSGKSAREVSALVAEHVRPFDGSQDADATRRATAEATSDLLQESPQANLASLTPDQIDAFIANFVGHDLCQRIELDIGHAILEKAPTTAEAVERLDDMKVYVQTAVRLAFDRLRPTGTLSGQRIRDLVKQVLEETLEVFEGYIL